MDNFDDQLFNNQQATMETTTIFDIPTTDDIPISTKKPIPTSTNTRTTTVIPIKLKINTSVTYQYGVRPAALVPKVKEEPAQYNAPEVKKGSIVVHKNFGEGTVTKLDKEQKHIREKFDVGEKIFIFPDAFKQEFLKTK